MMRELTIIIASLVLLGQQAYAQAVPPALPGKAALPAMPEAKAPTSLPPVPSAAPTASTPSLPALKEEKPPTFANNPLTNYPIKEAEPVAEEAEEEIKPIEGFSFGDAPHSIMFTAEQAEAMRNVLSSVESIKSSDKPTTARDTTPLPFLNQPKNLAEPKPYPVFYLASIMYRNGSDWTVWLSDRRITPKTNEGELTVAAISPDIVTFEWRPGYMPALIQRQRVESFAPLDKVKNRLTTQANTVSFNIRDEVISFTLRSNQSFGVAYMSTFEGKIETADVPAVDGSVSVRKEKEKDKESFTKLEGEAKRLLEDMAGEDAAPPPAEVHGGPIAIDPNTIKMMQSMQQMFQNQMNAGSGGLPTLPPAGTPAAPTKNEPASKP